MRFCLDSIKSCKEQLEKSSKIAIIPHVNADGDAIGSSIALYHILNSMGKSVAIISPSNFPNNLKWLKGASDIVVADNTPEEANQIIEEADLHFYLDLNQYSRFGDMQSIFIESKISSIMIDHHPYPDTIADIILSDTTASSTAELIYSFAEACDILPHLDKNSAEGIMVGITTDTGNFSHNCSNPDLYNITASLIRKGINRVEINSKLFNQDSIDRLQLSAYLVSNNLTYLTEQYSSIITVTEEEKQRYNFQKGYLDGVVNRPLSIANTVCSILIAESEDGDYTKISFRSVADFPINELSKKYFNGGGHTNAAGGRYDGTVEETLERVKMALLDFQELLDKTAKEIETI